LFNGYDLSKYEVSNYGKFRNVKNKRLLKPSNTGSYLSIKLITKNMENYSCYVHQLVAFKFIENGLIEQMEIKIPEKIVVNHKDENKENNYYKNLEWITQQNNAIHSIGRKVKQINIDTGEIIKIYNSISEAYKALGKDKC